MQIKGRLTVDRDGPNELFLMPDDYGTELKLQMSDAEIQSLRVLCRPEDPTSETSRFTVGEDLCWFNISDTHVKLCIMNKPNDYNYFIKYYFEKRDILAVIGK